MTWLIRIAGVLLLAALIAIGAASFVGGPEAGAAGQAKPAVRPLAFAPLPPVDPAARRSILDRSPFIQGRSTFDRQTAMTPPPPPVEVRLTGIMKLGKQLRASLLVGGQSVLVTKGDDTPIGKVTSIEASAVVIEGATTRRLEMFKP